jgi:zinc-finger of transposase IS204/IS1001/IS1096/IS1165
MTEPSFLLGLPQLAIDQIEITQELITLIAHVEASEACCPRCGYESSRVHSRYRRTLQDLPCVGKIFRLVVQVRRWFLTIIESVHEPIPRGHYTAYAIKFSLQERHANHTIEVTINQHCQSKRSLIGERNYSTKNSGFLNG